MAKLTTVSLTCEALGARDFEITQAETLLNMKPNGGWELNDKNYKFENGMIVRTNKGKDNETAQKGDD